MVLLKRNAKPWKCCGFSRLNSVEDYELLFFNRLILCGFSLQGRKLYKTVIWASKFCHNEVTKAGLCTTW